MNPIRLTRHAKEQSIERGATEEEVRQAVLIGSREEAKHGRIACRANFQFHGTWQGKPYAIKQVMPIIKEEADETVVVTVYTFYF